MRIHFIVRAIGAECSDQQWPVDFAERDFRFYPSINGRGYGRYFCASMESRRTAGILGLLCWAAGDSELVSPSIARFVGRGAGRGGVHFMAEDESVKFQWRE